ncbi:MAG: M23 family peptidase [Xanthobacteraceae bacterium]
MSGGNSQTGSAVPGGSLRRPWSARAIRTALAGSIALLCHLDADAQDFKTPVANVMRPDWRAAHEELRSEFAARADGAGLLTFSGARRLRPDDPRRWPAFVQLNAITSQVFPAIDQSPVPVLLPFDAAAYLGERASGVPASVTPTHYQAGFRTAMFDAGPAGYDAVFALDPTGAPDMPARVFKAPIEVHITGSLLVYAIDDPLAGKGEPVKALASQFPGLRRVIREGYVRYAFTRFGVPYVVSILCLDSVPRRNRLACREASTVAERFLGALRVDGGKPHRPRGDLAAAPVDRPQARSPDFTYRPVGSIISNSGYRGQPGRADPTVYTQIRFPLRDAPAFANSQSFLNWGDCNFTGRTATPRTKGGSYRCKRNDKPLVFDESAHENYSYPWQDNFCESRQFEVGQCATGFGHQGQDIRPSSCPLRNEGADRCQANHYGIVAVRDGVILRGFGQQAAFLVIDTALEHVRVRYMHMTPSRMDADALLNGRSVNEGEQIGVVSNFQDFPGGTTSHLHFDLQVFTRDGWLWVNPYATLIASYEHLLGARGTEIPSEPVAAAAVAHAGSDEAPPPAAAHEGE